MMAEGKIIDVAVKKTSPFKNTHLYKTYTKMAKKY
jgi:hypothetical protein